MFELDKEHMYLQKAGKLQWCQLIKTKRLELHEFRFKLHEVQFKLAGPSFMDRTSVNLMDFAAYLQTNQQGFVCVNKTL